MKTAGCEMHPAADLVSVASSATTTSLNVMLDDADTDVEVDEVFASGEEVFAFYVENRTETRFGPDGGLWYSSTKKLLAGLVGDEAPPSNPAATMEAGVKLLVQGMREALRAEVEPLRRDLAKILGDGPGPLPDKLLATHRGGDLWTVKQAATYLGLSESSLYHLAADGTVPSCHAGNALRFDPDELRAWVRRHRKPSSLLPAKK